MYMKFKNKTKEIVFIHIPRTSGSYIERELCKKYQVKLEWPKPNMENLFGLLKINDHNYFTLQHLTLQEMIKNNFIDLTNDQYIFTLVRHPYERIPSFYKWFSQTYHSFDLFLDKLEQMNLNEYDHTGMNVSDNFNYVNATLNINDVIYFILPQYKYIETLNNTNINVDVMNYTNMKKIGDNLGLKLQYKKPRQKNLTDEQKEKIYNIYKGDFERFNFQK